MPRELEIRARRLLAQAGIRYFYWDLYQCQAEEQANSQRISGELNLLADLYESLSTKTNEDLKKLCDALDAGMSKDINSTLAMVNLKQEFLPHLSLARAEDQQSRIQDVFSGKVTLVSELLDHQEGH